MLFHYRVLDNQHQHLVNAKVFRHGQQVILGWLLFLQEALVQPVFLIFALNVGTHGNLAGVRIVL